MYNPEYLPTTRAPTSAVFSPYAERAQYKKQGDRRLLLTRKHWQLGSTQTQMNLFCCFPICLGFKGNASKNSP